MKKKRIISGFINTLFSDLKGYKINKGWNINIDARSIHLDPNVYCEPHKFNPSRFDVRT